MPRSLPQSVSPEQLEQIGRIAANMVRDRDRVGLGSGRAALAFVRMLGQRIAKEGLKIVGVPTSLATEQAARDAGVPLASLEETENLELAIDGADEVDPFLNLTKGGGGNLTREKVIASIAKKLVICVGQEKLVEHLGSNFPVFIEVIEFARPTVMRKLRAMGGQVTQRQNPEGSIFLTDNHNPYLHCRFGQAPHTIADPATLEQAIKMIPGVVETGLFVDMTDEVIIARFDGTVERKRV